MITSTDATSVVIVAKGRFSRIVVQKRKPPIHGRDDNDGVGCVGAQRTETPSLCENQPTDGSRKHRYELRFVWAYPVGSASRSFAIRDLVPGHPPYLLDCVRMPTNVFLFLGKGVHRHE